MVAPRLGVRDTAMCPRLVLGRPRPLKDKRGLCAWPLRPRLSSSSVDRHRLWGTGRCGQSAEPRQTLRQNSHYIGICRLCIGKLVQMGRCKPVRRKASLGSISRQRRTTGFRSAATGAAPAACPSKSLYTLGLASRHAAWFSFAGRFEGNGRRFAQPLFSQVGSRSPPPGSSTRRAGV